MIIILDTLLQPFVMTADFVVMYSHTYNYINMRLKVYPMYSHLITGTPHGIYPSSLNLFGVCLYMGRIYILLFKKQLDRVLLSLMKSM